MAKQMLTYFKRGNIMYLVLLCIDLIVELFQIDKTSTVITLFGIKIITKMTPTKLNTTFLLDSRIIWSYLITILLFLILGYFMSNKKNGK